MTIIVPTQASLEIARRILRRGAAPGEPIPPCECFRSDAQSTPRCMGGVCEEVAANVAMALDRVGDGLH